MRRIRKEELKGKFEDEFKESRINTPTSNAVGALDLRTDRKAIRKVIRGDVVQRLRRELNKTSRSWWGRRWCICHCRQR
jgi:hypothetical protein